MKLTEHICYYDYDYNDDNEYILEFDEYIFCTLLSQPDHTYKSLFNPTPI